MSAVPAVQHVLRVVVLDTDVASSLLRRRTPDAVAARLTGHGAAVAFVTVGELTTWRWPPGGGIRANAQLRGRPRSVNDSWITACRLVRDAPIATVNAEDSGDCEDFEDFEDFAEHDGPDQLVRCSRRFSSRARLAGIPLAASRRTTRARATSRCRDR